jgi:hypothetical protein
METHALKDPLLPQLRAEAASVLGLTDAKGNMKASGR